jgi:NAD(P)-dependent dehydrogenase (short-subunit alcohol dehydrogenase family)
MSSLFSLDKEVAVVIGATGMLGGAIAEGLAGAGAAIAVVGRNEERGTKCAESIKKKGKTAYFFKADVCDKTNLEKIKKEIEIKLGPPDILVNAAGGNSPKGIVSEERSFQSISKEDWNSIFDINLIGGTLLPCQVFGPAMVARQKGSIINIASVSAHVPLSKVVAYSSAKAAVLNLTQFLAREWASSSVRVNTITPGFFPAEQNRGLLFNADGTPSPRAQTILNHTPMKRFGKSDELIGAVLFLASERASSFVTGSDIRVDGGFLAQTI